MNKIFIAASLIFIWITNYSQTISEFKEKLDAYKSEYRAILFKNESSEELKNELNYLSSKIENLIDDIESNKENELMIKQSKKELLIEVNEFERFTSAQQCYCIYYFNKFMAEMGSRNILLNEKEDVRIFKATLGNFIYYYAYSLNNNKLYSISITLFKPENDVPASKFTTEVGLGNEIETLIIVSKAENKKYSYSTIKSEKILDPNYIYNPCNETFPRN